MISAVQEKEKNNQGVFLSGMYRIWKLCRDNRCFQYIKDWVDSVVDAEGNWLENSCSCLYVAAICKAVHKGLLPAGYLEHAKKGYKAF